MGENYFNRQEEAPFNMAIATLKRLDLILIQIRQLHCQYFPESIIKQKAHVDLVKQFYLNAVPLFNPDEDDKNKQTTIEELGAEILSFKMENKSIIRNGNQRQLEIYSYDKEKRLNEIICELQTKLKRFFMPGKRRVEGLM